MSPKLDPRQLLAQRAWIERLAHGLVDPATADDLVQEAWIAALERPPRRRESLRPWLKSVVHNLARERRRGEGRRSWREKEVARREDTPTTDELVERAELQQLLASGIVELREPYRDVLLLRYFEGLSSAEIARRKRVPAATVRSQLQRGLEELRRRLDERYDGDRRTWGLALAGLVSASRITPLPPEGFRFPWLEGVLAMKTSWIVASGVGALALSTVLFSDWGPTKAAPEKAASNPAIAAPDSLLVAEEARPSEPIEVVPDAPRRQAEVPVSEPAEVAPAFAFGGLRAVVQDPGGASLEGARLSVSGSDLIATSDGSGLLELPFPADQEIELWRVDVRAAGYAPGFLEVTVRPGEVVHLGTITLDDAVRLGGRVVDADGVGLADLTVLVAPVEGRRSDPEELRRQGPATDRSTPLTKTDSEGFFLLDAVPTGTHLLWAGGNGWTWSSLGPLLCESGDRHEELELLLTPLATTDSIAGVLRDPSGAGVSGARIEFWFDGVHWSSGEVALTDEEGRFEYLVQQRVPHDVTAVDPERRFSPVFVSAVQPGELDLELTFAEPRPLFVTVESAGGEPPSEFRLKVERQGRHGPDEIARATGTQTADGLVAEALIPELEFTLLVEARGHIAQRLGPFDPAVVADHHPVILEPLPGIAGRVLTPAGKPVPGARVELQQAVGPGQLVEISGFPALYHDDPHDQTTTDSEGRFVLYATRDRTYRVCARVAGYAPTLFGPAEWGPSNGARELELRLQAGGIIEGRLLLPPGASASGRILAYHSGDGQPRTLRLGPDGHYRLERLTPGPWHVSLTDNEIHPDRHFGSYRSSDEKPDMDWRCEVIEGEVTRYDIDLRAAKGCLVRGSFRLGTQSLVGWSAALETEPASVILTEIKNASALDPAGRFELETDQPGDYYVVLRGPRDTHGRLMIYSPLRLDPGETTWSLDTEAARVVGQGAQTGAGAEHFYELRAHLPDHGAEVVYRIVPNAQGRFVLEGIPAGQARIRSFERRHESGPRAGKWEDRVTIEVPRSGEVTVRLD